MQMLGAGEVGVTHRTRGFPQQEAGAEAVGESQVGAEGLLSKKQMHNVATLHIQPEDIDDDSVTILEILEIECFCTVCCDDEFERRCSLVQQIRATRCCDCHHSLLSLGFLTCKPAIHASVVDAKHEPVLFRYMYS